MSNTDTDRSSHHAEENARAWAASIVAMVTRYEHATRCTEAREDCEALPWEVRDALQFLDRDRDATDEEWSDYHDEADAEQRISESVLEVLVRGDWHTPGERSEDAEFQILLTTGGPALRIKGELDHHGVPRRAWLEHQDWGTPWTPFWDATTAPHDAPSTLLAFASHFPCFRFH